MVKLRLSGDKEEIEVFINALQFLECIKDSDFSTPAKGGNPRYKDSKDVLSYGTLSINLDKAKEEGIKGQKIKKLKKLAGR